MGQYRIIYPSGIIRWFDLETGMAHRVGGPTIIYENGTKLWLEYGQYHREDGPAIEYYNGTKDWYFHDKRIDCKDQETFERIIKLKAFW